MEKHEKLTEALNESIAGRVRRLDELPPLITKALEETNHREEIKDLENGMKDILLGFEMEAGMEVDDNHKKIYTNQAARESRARELAKSDADYQMLAEQHSQLTARKQRADSLLETLRLEFQGQKAALYAFTEMLKTTNLKLAAAPKVVAVEVHHDAQ